MKTVNILIPVVHPDILRVKRSPLPDYMDDLRLMRKVARLVLPRCMDSAGGYPSQVFHDGVTFFNGYDSFCVGDSIVFQLPHRYQFLPSGIFMRRKQGPERGKAAIWNAANRLYFRGN